MKAITKLTAVVLSALFFAPSVAYAEDDKASALPSSESEMTSEPSPEPSSTPLLESAPPAELSQDEVNNQTDGAQASVAPATMPPVSEPTELPSATPDLPEVSVSASFRVHCSNIGWEDAVGNGETAGSDNSGRVEAFQLNVSTDNVESVKDIVSYRAYVQYSGWQEWKHNGETAGTTGKGYQIEAIEAKPGKNISDDFDLYYRVCVLGSGWLSWAKNGDSAGTNDFDLPLSAVQFKFVRKGEETPEKTGDSFFRTRLSYQAHVQDIGWQSYVENGHLAGTTGQAKQMEALRINLDHQDFSGGVRYRAHVKNIGWQNWSENNAMTGTVGRSLQMEAVQMQLTGEMSEHFDLYYRVHVQNYGWLDWAFNGNSAGSTGFCLRVEAIEIRLLPKGSAAPGKTDRPFLSVSFSYHAHVANIGWQGNCGNTGIAGTTGLGLRVEALQMNLGTTGISGSVQYRVHVQNIGWQDWATTGGTAGTTGMALQVEALQVRLQGDIAGTMNIWYRVYVENVGWMNWTVNGGMAGTTGYGLRIEAIQFYLLPKGSYPGAFGSNVSFAFSIRSYLGAPNYNQYRIGAPVGCEGVSLFEALQVKGKLRNMNVRDFLKTIPHSTDGTPFTGFVGSPFVSNSRLYTAIFPSPLAAWGSRYEPTQDYTGSSVDTLMREIQYGNPVIAFVTIHFYPPVWTSTNFGTAMSNNHAVCLDGYDPINNQVHVSDPIDGSYWMPVGKFAWIYNFRKYAVVVK